MDKALLERLYNNLPKSFRNADEKQSLQLKRYLDILVTGGFGPLQKETQEILNLLDFDKIPYEYLPHLASDLGFRFPYDLDEQTQRTYVRNAVTSYRMKGTKKALLFMLRELTRFRVNVNSNEDEKMLTVTVEVTNDRQDVEFLRDKVRFIIDEYAPPYGALVLLNVFVWDEFFDNRHIRDDFGQTYLFFYSSHDDESALYFNHHQLAILNSLDYRLSNFQQFDRNRIRYTDMYRVKASQEDTLLISIKDTLNDTIDGTLDDTLETPVHIRKRDNLTFNRAHQRDIEIMHITDEGLGTFKYHEGIILNEIDHGLNRADRRLGDIEVIDLQIQQYNSMNKIDYVTTFALGYDYEEIYTPEIAYRQYKLNIKSNPLIETYQKPTYETILKKLRIYSVTDELLTKPRLEEILRDAMAIADTERLDRELIDIEFSLISEDLFTEDAIRQFIAEEQLDHLRVISTAERNYLFILSEPTSTTQSDTNQISGTIERWLREKYAIIGKENQLEFSNPETYSSMETQDEHTDIIIRITD